MSKLNSNGHTSCFKAYSVIVSLVKESIETFENDKNSSLPLNAFLEMYDNAISKAEACDKEIEQAKNDGTLDDLFNKKDKKLFCSNRSTYDIVTK